jgi:hypothetical protein
MPPMTTLTQAERDAIEAVLRKQFNSRLLGPEGGVLIFSDEIPTEVRRARQGGNMNEAFEVWWCANDSKKACPHEGCPANYGCAREHGWRPGQPSPPECTGRARPPANE